MLDSICGRFVQFYDRAVGFGHNWIMQGSIREAQNSERFTNYVFLDKKEALNFVRKQGRKVARYKGSRTSNFDPLVRKPKLLIYNLEDFLEFWEDTIQRDGTKTIFDAKATVFVPQEMVANEIFDFRENNKDSIFRNIKQNLNIKARTLKQFCGIFFSVS